MKERPILFSGAMVRAILSGAKTQTRRVVKPQPADDVAPRALPNPEAQGWQSSLRHRFGPTTLHMCPYGQPGGRLYVKETWAPFDSEALIDKAREFVFYRADDERKHETDGKWRPSIFMPRWASRITLEITSVRVERLQAISYEDAIAEGVADMAALCDAFAPGELNIAGESSEQMARRLRWPQRQFENLWNSINGPGSWDANPWVWVVEFRRVES